MTTSRRPYPKRPDRCEVDPLNVEAALAGSVPGGKLNHCERIEAVRRLKAANVPHLEIAARLKISDRSVDRYSAKLRDRAAA